MKSMYQYMNGEPMPQIPQPTKTTTNASSRPKLDPPKNATPTKRRSLIKKVRKTPTTSQNVGESGAHTTNFTQHIPPSPLTKTTQIPPPQKLLKPAQKHHLHKNTTSI